MSRDEVEEYFSEDLGFRLSTGKLGVQLFDAGVDFGLSSVSQNPLQLLHVGHAKKLYVASNNQQVGVGKLTDLSNDEESIKQNFIATALKNVTYVRFDATNDFVYAIADGQAYKASTDKILQKSSSPFTQLNLDASVQALEPSPSYADSYCFLTSGKKLHIIHGDSETIVSDINGFAWTFSGTDVVIVTDTSIKFMSVSGCESGSYAVVDGGVLFSVFAIDDSSFYVVGKPEDSNDDDVHTLVERKNGNFTSKSLAMPPAFGEVTRSPAIYSVSLVDWTKNTSLAFAASGLVTEITTIECGTNTRAVVQSNDTDRAELPMDDDTNEDTLPVGFGLDLSGPDRVIRNPTPLIEEAVGLPRLLCLNNQGCLFVWDIFDAKGVRENLLDLHRSIAKLPKAEGAPKRTGSITSNQFAKTLDTSVSGLRNISGGTGFGSQTPAAPAFPQQNAVSSGFGATSFGAAKAGKSMFGADDFKAGSSAPKPAFGATGFGAPPSSQTTTFGASGFGSKTSTFGAGSSGFGTGASGFGSNAVFGQASFDSKKPDAPFGSVPSSGQTQGSFSGFGTNSKFGSLQGGQSSTSPFATLAKETGSSPFGSLAKNDKASPFGDLNPSVESKDSVPAFTSQKQNATGSSFGILKQDSKASPFSELKSSDSSPFATLNKDDKASPFSGLKQDEKASPFAALKQNETYLPLGSFKSDGMASLFSEQKNDEKTPTSSGFNSQAPSFSLNGTQNNNAFTGESKNSESGSDAESESDWESQSQNSGSSDESPSASEDATPEKLTFSDMNLSGTSGPPVAEKETKSSSMFGPGNGLFTSGTLAKQVSSTNLKDNESAEAFKQKPNFGGIASSVSSKPAVESSAAVSEPTKLETAPTDSKESSDEKQIVSVKEENVYDDKDIGEIIKLTELLKFGGFSETPEHSENEISNKFTELVQLAQGNMDVLELNAEKAASIVEAAGQHRKTLEAKDLEFIETWALGDLGDLARIATGPRESLDGLLVSMRRQKTKLSELLGQVSESEAKKEDLEKVVTQLALFKQSLESSKLSKRPLDVRAEMLRHQLRKKLAKVELLQEEIAQKLFPLGVKLDLGQGTVARVQKLEKVVREVSSRARELARDVKRLESEALSYCENVPISNGDDVQFLAICPAKPSGVSRFELAQKFDNGVKPRKIKPVVI